MRAVRCNLQQSGGGFSSGIPNTSAICLGGGRGTLIASGSPRSCCSKRGLRRWFPITSDSWTGFQMLPRWPRRPSRICWPRGRG